MRVQLNRGLDVRIAGAPRQQVDGQLDAAQVAHVISDYGEMRVRMGVAVGDRVVAGQPLFSNRRHPAMMFSADRGGLVRHIDHGAGRRVTRVVIDCDGNASAPFPEYSAQAAMTIAADELRELLLKSGAWPSLRSRPYARIASPDIQPRALFITAIDTNPLAPDPATIIAANDQPFATAVSALSALASGPTYVCTAADASIRLPDCERLVHAQFDGPHPAGLPGTHMHAVGVPMTMTADLWHIGYQDVIAIGELLLTGRWRPSRTIALAGPAAARPRLLRSAAGASLQSLQHEALRNDCRVVSGSPLHGVPGAEFLGRYHNQVTLFDKTAVEPGWSFAAWLRGLLRNDARQVSDSGAGNWPSGMLAVESFDRVWPFSTPPAALLRALLAGDSDGARRLGCVGLAEEDLALCAFVCPSRRDYGAALRETLKHIERTG